MKYVLSILVVALMLPLAACGHKGKLKSPEQIEAEAAKKASEQAPSAGGEEKEEVIQVSPPELKPQGGSNLHETRPLSPSVGNY